MGSALGSSGLAFAAALIVAVSAILILVADSKVRGIPGYDEDILNQDLDVARTDLITAKILSWVGVVFSILLAVGYILVNFEFLQNEWVHLIILLVAVGSLIASIVYLGFAMKRVNNLPEIQGDNGSYSMILWSLIVMALGVLILIVMGIWRLTNKRTKKKDFNPADEPTMGPVKETTVKTKQTAQGTYVTSTTQQAIPNQWVPRSGSPAAPPYQAEAPSMFGEV